MKRRALLSGIVPAVAGAAGACRSSVANVLTGGVPSSASGTLPTKEIAWLLAVQWFAAISRGSELSIATWGFRKVDKNDECMKNALSDTNVFGIRLKDVYEKSEHGASCIGRLADDIVKSNIRVMMERNVAVLLESLDLTRHKEDSGTLWKLRCQGRSPLRIIAYVEHESETSTRAYYIRTSKKIPLAIDVSFQSMVWSDDIEDVTLNIRIDMKMSSENIDGVYCVETPRFNDDGKHWREGIADPILL